ncbi:MULTISPECIES: chaperone modulator CbpM [Pseudomonas]|uniref:Chaperone modulatory protein CbpM n=1 Tax=Pseudomonas brassicacearum TaxID=930166 RepID=A0AAJ3FUH5_9PSED|nr:MULTISPECIES: chaperone modulator CbpM [Pseudomonas]NUT80533.1 chaperone modulatory protein CbpM [Pseudomonas brassicacearum]QGA48169.1 chaperone modulatory protein CbpM [Pseudomonas brassicacearum]CAH0314686.1 Chaperone modulatory protein CbpM [Pseudomonas brassicacearum]
MNNPIIELNLREFCEAAALLDVHVIEIVEHGILEPHGAAPSDWRFTDYELVLARRAAKLRRELELEWEGVALALDLLEEVQQLRAENRRLRQQLGRWVG